MSQQEQLLMMKNKAKQIVEQLTENVKVLNENHPQIDYMFSFIEETEKCLIELGFSGEVLCDLTVFMIEKLEIDSEVPEFKKALYEETIQSDFLMELAKLHQYAYNKLKSKGFDHPQTMKLLHAFHQ